MKKPNKSFFPNHSKNIKNGLIALLVLFGLFFMLHRLTDMSRNVSTISYSMFLEKVEQGLIKKIHASGQDVEGILKDGSRFETVIGNNPKDWDSLRQHGVEFSVDSPSNHMTVWYIFPFICLLLALWGGWYFIRQARNNGGGAGGNGTIFTMGKSGARMFLPTDIKVNFTSVAGAQEAKEELADIVDFLKNPKKYESLGARITKGVLLVGEPGNGKTLLARAVAGEANCPFFSISGSNFIEVFVGVGAARVRDLFAQARKHAPCIIFIDEIDAVGRHRGSGLGGGNDEREQTLNQLLAEMDGFETSSAPIIVLAATNRPDVLDKALLRPGRFDHQISISYPDLQSREDILSIHTKNIKISKTVDSKIIAQAIPGFSGADIANLTNKAATEAAKKDKKHIDMTDFETARDKILLGTKLTSIRLTPEDKKLIAYHEGGHALVRLLLPEDTDPLHKVTIIPRTKGALGATHFLPEREKYIQTKEEMEASILSALGGRAAEELIFGKLTTGAYSDFQVASKIIRTMICHYGMSQELGTIIYDQNGSFDYSQKTAEKIDEAVRQSADIYYKKAYELLEQNRDKLDILADELLKKETLQASEIYKLLNIEPRTQHHLVEPELTA